MSLVLLGNSGNNSENTTKNTNPKHSLVKVFANGEQDMKRIMREGLFFDHTDPHGWRIFRIMDLG